MSRPLTPTPVRLRHIKRGASTDPGAVQVLGTWFVPQRLRGVNGRLGFQSGERSRRRDEEGDFRLSFPNAAGEDGVMHRDRFDVITDPHYAPGDEFIEVWEGAIGDGDPVFVGTPIDYEIGSSVELSGFDALWLPKHTRETAAGFFCHAPRDAFEHATRCLRVLVADPFDRDDFVYSTSPDTTADGQWTYERAESVPEAPGSVRLRAGTSLAYVEAAEDFGEPDDTTPWRIDCEVFQPSWDGSEGEMIRLSAEAPGEPFMRMTLNPYEVRVERTGEALVVVGRNDFKQAIALAIEGRGRWVFFYVDGALVSVMPQTAGLHLLPRIGFQGTSSDEYIDVRHLVVRRADPFLLRGPDKGDLHLPGAPTAGGLIGSYFSEVELPASGPSVHQLLAPTKAAYARRQDAVVNFSAGSTWMPPGTPDGEKFSARWTGALRLDLAPSDVFLRVTSDARHRLYIGKTRAGDEYLDDWTEAGHTMTAQTGGSLRTHLAAQVSGWYPIILEYHNGTDDAGCILEWATNVSGPWTVVPAAALSPLGIFESQVRYESHYELLMQIRDTFGLQFTCQPKQLESGLFPGQVVPRVREGRDTAAVISENDVVEPPVVRSNAEDRADALLADASGLADPQQAAQLTAELFNFDQLADHLFLHQEYESEGDITIPELLLQRLDSRLALRSSPWEEVSARPRGHRDLVDRFPLTGDLANYEEFKWAPGDGVRLDLPTRRLKDEIPRALMAVSYRFVPDGIGPPEITFRQRPRDAREAIRRIQRRMLAQQRNYQGQLATVTGAPGSRPTTAAIPSAITRVSLPNDLSRVVKAEFVVTYKDDDSAVNIEVNGTARASFDRPGRYDITPWIGPDSHGRPRMFAEATGGTGETNYSLELLVRV